MIDLPVLNARPVADPLNRKAEKGLEEDLPSPMDPPESFAPPTVAQIPYEAMAEPLKRLMDDHETFLKILNAFDNALIALKQNQWRFTPETSAALKRFFQAMDGEIADHTRREEKGLFPLLHRRFLESGEHSPGPRPTTPVDVMESDHRQVAQAAALVFNLLGLAPRMRDPQDRDLLFEHAFGQGQEIVEIMKLHIYKENTTLFPLAQTLLSADDLEYVRVLMNGL